MAEKNETIDAAARVSALLAEYAEKLLKLSAFGYHVGSLMRDARRRADALNLQQQREQFLIQRERIKPPIVNLIQHASQLIEHSDLDVTIRVELQLRLADLENALVALDQVRL